MIRYESVSHKKNSLPIGIIAHRELYITSQVFYSCCIGQMNCLYNRHWYYRLLVRVVVK